jgi:hypothetical protein
LCNYNAPQSPTMPSQRREAITISIWAGPGLVHPLEQAHGATEGRALSPAIELQFSIELSVRAAYPAMEPP